LNPESEPQFLTGKDSLVQAMNVILTEKEELRALVRRAMDVDAVGIDTEFVWEKTYYPQLGLIQISLSNEDCYLIDPLAIDDLTYFGQLLSDTSVVKIFHDAPQDLAILSAATGSIPKNIFDTRIGAGFAGLPSTLSLANLAKELLDIKLTKGQTRTDWLRRPLKKKQIEYGLDDVRYLRALRVCILASCVNNTAKSWMLEEMKLLGNLEGFNGIQDNRRYERVKGVNGLNRKSLSALRELTIWREKEARRQDRPRGYIIQDNMLVALARHLPKTVEEATVNGSLSGKKADRYGSALIDCIEKGCNISKENYPPRCKSIQLTENEKGQLKDLQNIITLECDVNGIDPALVGNMKELKTLVKNNRNLDNCPQLRLATGWRRELIKTALSI